MNYTGKTFKEATKEDLVAIAEAGGADIRHTCNLTQSSRSIVLHDQEARINFYEHGEIYSGYSDINTFAAVDKARELGYYLPSNTGGSSD